MSDTEKLLAEIEAGLEPRALADFEFMKKASGWLPQLVKIVREHQNDIEQERILKQAARLEAVTLQKQLDRQQDGIDYTKGKLVGLAERYQAQLEEMRGDLVELLEKLYVPMSGDGYRELVQVAGALRAKYLEVKS